MSQTLFCVLSFDVRLVSESLNHGLSDELRRRKFRSHGGNNRVLLIALYISFSEIFSVKVRKFDVNIPEHCMVLDIFCSDQIVISF